ncbi:MAG: hypothetical protein DYG89_15705 [Caldilinea sp. CFX5]|nr:hypothetical protein [Caldilinea sp. CFX5]
MTLVTLLRLGLLVLLLTLIWQGWPQRLDVTLGETATVYQANAGAFAVTITLIPHGNDNGPVDLNIYRDQQLLGVIPAQYNYDSFANQPAGWLRRTWVDGDWRRDLMLITANRPGYAYVSSEDGKLYRVETGE